MAQRKSKGNRKTGKSVISKSKPAVEAAPVNVVAVFSTPVRNTPVPRAALAAAPVPRIVTKEMVAVRAYEISISGGGSDVENWLQAERELLAA